MNILLAILIAIAVLLIAGVALLITNRRGGVALVVIAVPICTCLLGFAAIVWVAPTASGGPYGQTRVSLTGARFDLSHIHTISVGGDPEIDDIVIAPRPTAAIRGGTYGRLPSRVLVITRSPLGGVDLQVTPQQGVHTRAIVRVKTGASAVYLGATEMPPDIAVCSMPCSGADSRSLKSGSVYYSNHFLFLDSSGQPYRAAPDSLWFAGPDDAQVFQAGTSPLAVVLHLPANANDVAVEIFEAELSSARIGNVSAQPGRLIARRSFHLSLGDEPRYLNVGFDTSQERLLPRQDRDAGKAVMRIVSGAAAGTRDTSSGIAVPFSLLGRSFDADLRSVRLDLPRSGAQQVLIRAPEGRILASGQTIRIGQDYAATVRVQPLDFSYPPLQGILVLGLLSLLCSIFATYQLRLTDPFAGLLFAVLEFLLIMRLLIAVEGSFVDGARGAQLAVPTAVVALTFAPCLVMLAHPMASRYWKHVACLSVGFILASGAAWFLFGRVLLISVVGMGLIVIFAWASWGRALFRLNALYAWLESLGRRRAASLAAAGSMWWRAGLGLLLSRGSWIAVTGAFAILLFRGALWIGGGFKEEIPISSQRLALSLVFVPLALMVLAPPLASAQRGWPSVREARTDSFTLLTAIVIGVLAPSVLVRDHGFALFALPAFLGALVVYFGNESALKRRTDFGWAFLIAVGFLAVLLGWALQAQSLLWGLALVVASLSFSFIKRPIATWLAPAAATLMLLLMVNFLVPLLTELSGPTIDIAKAVSLQDNQLRFLAVLDQDRLAQVGTRAAYALQDTVDHLRSYGDTDLGRGYFSLPPPTVLKPAHLTDYVSAVHLVSPFGRVGALAVIAVFASFAAAATWRAFRTNPTHPVRWIGLLAAYTLFLVSSYMILANLLAAPLTGRNVYLLAAWSNSDLIEGVLLFAIVSATLGPVALTRVRP